MDEYEFSTEEVLEQLPADLLMAVYEHLERSRQALEKRGQVEAIDTFAALAARYACQEVLGYTPELGEQVGTGRITLDVHDVTGKMFMTVDVASGDHNGVPFDVVASLGDASPMVWIDKRKYMVKMQDIVGAILSVMEGSVKDVGDE